MATARLVQAYRPTTRAHQRHAIRTFLCFTVNYNIDVKQLQENDILCYIESLVIKGLKYNSIVTHMSLLKNCFHQYKLPVELLELHNVKQMMRGLLFNHGFQASYQGHIHYSNP